MLPRQCDSRDKNKQVKNGETPAEWKKSPHKLAQKDTDACWTKKNNETHYGYKGHIKVDADRDYVGKEIPNHMENNIGLTNLVYNICRYINLKQKEACVG